MSTMTVSPAGLREIKSSEGWSSGPYWDALGKVWTAYYGETNGITRNSPRLTPAQGEKKLIQRFEKDYAWALEPFVKLRGFTQNMYDALASFIWNCGTGAVAASTRVGRELRARHWSAAGTAMLAWCKAGGKTIPGLLSRRQRERKLFLKPAHLQHTISTEVLTSWEKGRVQILTEERRIKDRHGGWGKVDPSHLKRAARAREELRQRAVYLRSQKDKTKLYRAQREKLITSVVNDV